ncbi:hypothetical protein PAMA_014418 [Pampus argenteus]
MFSAAIKGNSTSSRCLPNQNTSESLGATELATNLLSGEDPAGAERIKKRDSKGFPGVWTAAGQRDHEQTPGEERAVKEVGSRQRPTGMFVYHDGADEAPSLYPTLAPQVWVGTRQNWQRAANRIGRAD